MAVRPPRPDASRLDVALGALVSLGALTTLVTALCEVTGRPALVWALVSLGIAAVAAALYRVGRRRRARDRLRRGP